MFFSIHSKIYVCVLCVSFVLFSPIVHAEETYTVGTVYGNSSFRWDNENWFTLAHPIIYSFTIRGDGSSFGLTETGIPFKQYNIENSIGVRIQRFELQDHYHYIIDGEVVYTLEDFSTELAKAYERTLNTTRTL